MKIANKRKLIYVLPFQNHDDHDKVCLMIHMNVERFKLVHVIWIHFCKHDIHIFLWWNLGYTIVIAL
jgi:hypothetical protein